MVSVAIELSVAQLRLLRFFADREGPPLTTRSRTYSALYAQGLIYREEGSTRYEITALGRHAVAALEDE
jgi:hypothetical protein